MALANTKRALVLACLMGLVGIAHAGDAAPTPEEVQRTLDELDSLLAAEMPGIMARARAIVDGLSPRQADALDVAIERERKAKERVEMATERLRMLTRNEEAARVTLEVEALVRDRWPEIEARARSSVAAMSEKQRDALFKAATRTRIASERAMSATEALDRLRGANVDATVLAGGDASLFCSVCNARASRFGMECDRRAESRNIGCLLCEGLVASGEDECLNGCEANRESGLILCAVAERRTVEVCCL